MLSRVLLHGLQFVTEELKPLTRGRGSSTLINDSPQAKPNGCGMIILGLGAIEQAPLGN